MECRKILTVDKEFGKDFMLYDFTKEGPAASVWYANLNCKQESHRSTGNY